MLAGQKDLNEMHAVRSAATAGRPVPAGITPASHGPIKIRSRSTMQRRQLSLIQASERVVSVAASSTPPTPPNSGIGSAIPPFMIGFLSATVLVLGVQKLMVNKPDQLAAEQQKLETDKGKQPILSTSSSAPAPDTVALPDTAAAFQPYGASTPVFSLAGTSCWGRLVDVYDGDTAKVVLPLDGKLYKFSVRMYGIDAPEMKSKVPANREKAVVARNRLLQLATGVSPLPPISTRKDIVRLLDENVTLVWVECLEFDKYGRLLAKLYNTNAPGQKSFSQVLIDEKLAYEYFGETKLTEAEQEALA